MIREAVMGALGQHIDAMQKEIDDLKLELLRTKTELSETKERYDSLCSKIKNNANDNRNESDEFLTNYARNWK